MERLQDGDPQRIGAYRLLARLGAGGMGQVYLARSDRGRTVAVKLVREDLAAREEFRGRFRQEVRAARRVGGRWTAPVLDADTEAPVPWVATGYVAGPSLHTVVGGDHGPLPERSVRVLAQGLTHALQDIHAAGLIHRDLKPSNVLVTIDGPRVIDFGIARALETAAGENLTRTGALVGSPGFMAPEQVRGDRITPACDVFCLGSVLAFAASGRLPFGGSDSGVHALMFRIAQEPPELDGVPESLRDLVRDCLHKTPESRPSLDAILERLGPEDASPGPWLPGPLVAELGSHAVQLLDVENPEGGTAPTPALPPSPALPPMPALPPGPPPPAPTPTVISPNGTGTPPPLFPPAWANGSGHGHPPQPQYPHPHPAPNSTPHPNPYLTSPQPPHGYGHPHPAPPYGYGPPPPPEEEPRRSTRSTVALVVVALVVAVGAGGSVYAYMNGDSGKPKRAGGSSASPAPSSGEPTPGPATSGTSGTSPSPTPGESPAGDIPRQYLGSWAGSIDSGSGHSTRRLVIEPGKVGDTVLTLTADGPLDSGGTYHCVFRAKLAAAPTGPDGPLKLGPSTVESGPTTSCSPGAATTVTLLADGRLRRENDDTGEQLTYDKAGEQ
ncbi:MULTISPECIES: serine/threonine-protein kinase [unclassified Streptomyces]|uniref:serine/threonine-protein kinase n=1 Tax=unclassified Streptomyces TaxID=2593676 RepID=UPI0033F07F29